MNNDYEKAANEIIRSFDYMVKLLQKATLNYDGFIISSNIDGTWNVRYNGEVHAIPSYGSIRPAVNMMVKVFVPQGNQNLAYFI